MRTHLVIALFALALAACVPPLSELDRPCPCAPGWVCCPSGNVCVTEGSACPSSTTAASSTGAASTSTSGSTGGGCTLGGTSTGGTTSSTNGATSGTGGFTMFDAPTAYPLQGAAVGACLGDVDGDGRSEVIAAQANAVSVWFAAADGGLVSGAPTALADAPIALASADFDGDGRADLLLSQTTDGGQPMLELWLSNGDGTFRFAESQPISYAATLVGATAISDGGVVSIAVDGSGGASSIGGLVYFGGQGHLGTATSVVVPGASTSMAMGNFGAPGAIDALISAPTEMEIAADLSGYRATYGEPYGPQRAVAAGALTDGGMTDFVTVSYSQNQLTAYLNQGGYTFAPQSPVFLEGSGPGMVVLADFDGDGHLDAAVGNLLSNDITLVLGEGGGSFFPAGLYRLGAPPLGVLALDANGDGRADLVVLERTCAGGQLELLHAR